MSAKVGWVGLGDQGAPMARALAAAGFDLHVCVRREASLAALQGVPYVRHDALAELGAASDVVGLCLWDDLCGKTVRVQTGTFQDDPDISDRSAKCLAAGKPAIDVVSLKTKPTSSPASLPVAWSQWQQGLRR